MENVLVVSLSTYPWSAKMQATHRCSCPGQCSVHIMAVVDIDYWEMSGIVSILIFVILTSATVPCPSFLWINLYGGWPWQPSRINHYPTPGCENQGIWAVVSKAVDTTGPNLHIGYNTLICITVARERTCSWHSCHIWRLVFLFWCRKWMVCTFMFLLITRYFTDCITLFVASILWKK